MFFYLNQLYDNKRSSSAIEEFLGTRFYPRALKMEDFKVELELAGTKRADISVKLKGDKLYIQYLSARDNQKYEAVYSCPERDFDYSKADCRYEDGLLTVKIPLRAEKENEYTLDIR